MTYAEIIVKRRGETVASDTLVDQLRPLRASGHPFAVAFADALEAVVNDDLEADEVPLVAAIEDRRRELEGSDLQIVYRDFGAADREGRQTPAEMYAGIERTRTVGDLCRRTSKPYRSGLLLMKLLRATGVRSCLELGTCLGISGSYQAAALELNGDGRLVTLEGAEPVAAIAGETLARLGHGRTRLVTGRFQDTLADVLARHRPFDYAFIDGHHEEHATLDYFEAILPALTDEALLVFDDIRWSPGMLRAWERVMQHPTVEVAIDLVDLGFVWTSREPGAQHRFRLS